MREEIAENILVSDSTGLFLKALGVMVAGVFVSTGHLDVASQDAFSQNIQTIGGAVVTIISAYFLLAHAFESAMAELKWNYKPEDLPVKTVTTVTPAAPVTPTKTVTTVTPVIPVETSVPPVA